MRIILLSIACFLQGAVLVVALPVSYSVSWAQGRSISTNHFFEALYDVPIMPGLKELEQETTLFDTPEGRIAQASAVFNIKAQDVFAFYAQTLPQMGWKLIKNPTISAQEGNIYYQREDEILQIFAEKSNSSGIVHFYLRPVSAKPVKK